MKLLNEAIKGFRRLGANGQPPDDEKSDDIEFNLDAENGEPNKGGEPDEFNLDAESAEDEEPKEGGDFDNGNDPDEFNLDAEGSEGGEKGEKQPLDKVATQATEDPNRRGLIRTVKNAHLVYKRESEDGTFTELWVFNVDDLKNEMEIRKAILAGTDIPTTKTESPDQKQEYTIWTSGNVEMINVTGLPS
jgi:hypothetical protein